MPHADLTAEDRAGLERARVALRELRDTHVSNSKVMFYQGVREMNAEEAEKDTAALAVLDEMLGGDNG